MWQVARNKEKREKGAGICHIECCPALNSNHSTTNQKNNMYSATKQNYAGQTGALKKIRLLIDNYHIHKIITIRKNKNTCMQTYDCKWTTRGKKKEKKEKKKNYIYTF